jgi:hypothetical protein
MRKFRLILTALTLLPLSLILITTGGCSSAVKAPSGAAAERSQDTRQFNQAQVEAPARDEEIWIIAKAPAEIPAVPADRAPSLVARLPNQSETRAISPTRTDVQADIAGCVATIDLAQQFRNPFPTTIEAVYTFLLPADAAVTEFVMTIGQRKIRGILRDRADAQRLYQAARAQGYLASLLTQTRPGVLTQSIANVEPRQQIDVSLRYLQTLPYSEGRYTYRFPARGLGNFSLKLRLNAGEPIKRLTTPSGDATQKVEGSTATVTLAPQAAPQAADFLLHYQLAGGRLKPAPLPPTHVDSSQDFLTIDATKRASPAKP